MKRLLLAAAIALSISASRHVYAQTGQDEKVAASIVAYASTIEKYCAGLEADQRLVDAAMVPLNVFSADRTKASFVAAVQSFSEQYSKDVYCNWAFVAHGPNGFENRLLKLSEGQNGADFVTRFESSTNRASKDLTDVTIARGTCQLVVDKPLLYLYLELEGLDERLFDDYDRRQVSHRSPSDYQREQRARDARIVEIDQTSEGAGTDRQRWCQKMWDEFGERGSKKANVFKRPAPPYSPYSLR